MTHPVSIPGRDTSFPLIRTVKTGSGPTQPPPLNVQSSVFLRVTSGSSVKLTTRLHRVPRVKNTWGYTSTPGGGAVG